MATILRYCSLLLSPPQFIDTLFNSVPLSNQLQVPFINMRNIYEIREHPSRMYSWTALVTSQMVGGEVGLTYEVVISRTRYVERQTGNKTRIVACGVSLANAEDLGKWMGASEHTIFNFSPRFVYITPCLLLFYLLYLRSLALDHSTWLSISSRLPSTTSLRS
jgi:hypothetical protein